MNEVTLSTFKELLKKIGISAEAEPAFMGLYENRLKANMLNSVEFAVANDLEADNETQAFISKIHELFESTSVTTESGAEITFAELVQLSSGLRYFVWDEDDCRLEAWDLMVEDKDYWALYEECLIQSAVKPIADLFHQAENKFFAAVSELLLSASMPDKGIYWLNDKGLGGRYYEPRIIADTFCFEKYQPEVFKDSYNKKHYRLGRFTRPGIDEFGNQLKITWARTKWDFHEILSRDIKFPIYISKRALEKLRTFCKKHGMSVNFNVMKIVEALENNEPVSIHLLWGYAGIRAYVNDVPMLEFHVNIINDKLIATDFSEYEPSEVKHILEWEKPLAGPAGPSTFCINEDDDNI